MYFLTFKNVRSLCLIFSFFLVFYMCMRYQLCYMKLFWVIALQQTMTKYISFTLTFDKKIVRCLFSLPFICVWRMKSVFWKLFELLRYNKVWQNMSLWPWPMSDPKIYSCLHFLVFHLCMKYEVCSWKLFEFSHYNKLWQNSSVLTLKFDLLTPKSIGVFLSLSSICVWSMKSVGWKLFEKSCYIKVWQNMWLLSWPFIWSFNWVFLSLLVHLSQRLRCTIVITRCPSSVHRR